MTTQFKVLFLYASCDAELEKRNDKALAFRDPFLIPFLETRVKLFEPLSHSFPFSFFTIWFLGS